METLNHLRALLKHEVEDLISAEDQIISAMPMMIDKASDTTLKKSLQQHLKITQQQRKRLDKVQKLLSNKSTQEDGKKGLFSRLIGTTHECKGMKGIITEGQKIMKEKMTPAVMDAAIIAAAQKVEHYEICGYGTAKAYARELNLTEVEQLLDQTLSEEYEADDKLTELAVRKINKEAESNKRNPDGSYWSRSGGRSSSATSRSEARTTSPASSRTSTIQRRGTAASSTSSASRKKTQTKKSSPARKKTTSKAR